MHRGGAELRAYGDQHARDERGTPCELDCQLPARSGRPRGRLAVTRTAHAHFVTISRPASECDARGANAIGAARTEAAVSKLPRLSDPAERTISEVAEQTGVPIATIKYYIREAPAAASGRGSDGGALRCRLRPAPRAGA